MRESCKMVGDFPRTLGGYLAKFCRNLGLLSFKILKNLAEICSNTWQTLLYKFLTHENESTNVSSSIYAVPDT